VIDNLLIRGGLRQHVLTILIFHRVLSSPDPLRPGDPDTRRFKRMMDFMARNFEPLSLQTAAELILRGKLPKRACCITFDDGYADNLTNALPILEQFNLPATVFVATGYLNGGRMFNDYVIDAIANSNEKSLNLQSIELGVLALGTLELRQQAIASILDTIKFLPPTIRDERVRAIVKASKCGDLSNDIMLTSDQLCELSKRGVEIGGHTVAHTILTTLEDDRALDEMIVGRRQLESIIGRSVTSFAYPNGKPGRDYAEHHVEMVRRAGFERAVSTSSGVATHQSDIFQLPRFTPWGSNEIHWSLRMIQNAKMAN
jgi:peptidoglycan/xylan/chitin deacetylase (PgdA/CDA1 family)